MKVKICYSDNYLSCKAFWMVNTKRKNENMEVRKRSSAEHQMGETRCSRHTEGSLSTRCMEGGQNVLVTENGGTKLASSYGGSNLFKCN
jgi:hypothetical protein